MLNRSHIEPFISVTDGKLVVDYLRDSGGRVVPFLDRLCMLVRRLEGWPRDRVVEALRRQERRVKDAARLAGISKALLDKCEFRAPEGAEQAGEIRDAVYLARGLRWPPVPGDRRAPYERAGEQLGRTAADVERLLHADAIGAQTLVHAPVLDGRSLLALYNMELARAVLLDAERVRVSAKRGWRGIFRAVKSARLMHTVARRGKSYEAELSGPASSFVVRPARYGARFANVIPALARAPGWRLDADVRHKGRLVSFHVQGKPRAGAEDAPIGAESVRAGFDSGWERTFARDFRKRLGVRSNEWTLLRESTPVSFSGELFLPDFTLRHRDGREVLVEIIGFWTPEYLAEKVRKIRAAGLGNLVLVVYRGLAVGAERADLASVAGEGRIVWFTATPKVDAVIAVAEACAVRPGPSVK